MKEQDAVAELEALEARRLEAVSSGDIDAVRGLMDEGLIHVHATGKVETREEFLDGLARLPRKSARSSLKVRLLGHDVAVLTGEASNIVLRPGATEPEHVPMFVTQVCVRRPDGWRFASFHACRVS